MKKELKDYLHLYLGCELEEKETRYTLTRAQLLDIQNYELYSEIKLILRPLKEIKADEILEVLAACYTFVYSHSPEFENIELTIDSYPGIKASEDGGKWNYGLTIEPNSVSFSVNGDYLFIPNYELTRILLSKHLDIFGLIDCGLAINSK